MLKVGLTGGLACGKTCVAAMFRETAEREGRSCEVVNADELGHRAIEPGGPAHQAVLEAFGQDLADAGGRIPRARLAERVFGNPEAVARLNAIVHPAILAQVEERCRDFTRRHPRGILIVDAALILEAGVASQFQKIIVVDCTPEQQVARFTAKGQGGEEEARRRIAAQLPRAEKLRRADFVVDASGSLEETRRQVEAIYRKLEEQV